MPAAITTGLIDPPQVILPHAYDMKSAKRTIDNALAELQAANLAALPEIRT